MFLRDITVIFCHSTCHLYSFKGCSSDVICGPFAAKTHQSSLPSFIPTVSCAALVMETFIVHFNRTVQQHSAITLKRIFCTYICTILRLVFLEIFACYGPYYTLSVDKHFIYFFPFIICNCSQTSIVL